MGSPSGVTAALSLPNLRGKLDFPFDDWACDGLVIKPARPFLEYIVVSRRGQGSHGLRRSGREFRTHHVSQSLHGFSALLLLARCQRHYWRCPAFLVCQHRGHRSGVDRVKARRQILPPRCVSIEAIVQGLTADEIRHPSTKSSGVSIEAIVQGLTGGRRRSGGRSDCVSASRPSFRGWQGLFRFCSEVGMVGVSIGAIVQGLAARAIVQQAVGQLVSASGPSFRGWQDVGASTGGFVSVVSASGPSFRGWQDVGASTGGFVSVVSASGPSFRGWQARPAAGGWFDRVCQHRGHRSGVGRTVSPLARRGLTSCQHRGHRSGVGRARLNCLTIWKS